VAHAAGRIGVIRLHAGRDVDNPALLFCALLLEPVPRFARERRTAARLEGRFLRLPAGRLELGVCARERQRARLGIERYVARGDQVGVRPGERNLTRISRQRDMARLLERGVAACQRQGAQCGGQRQRRTGICTSDSNRATRGGERNVGRRRAAREGNRTGSRV